MEFTARDVDGIKAEAEAKGMMAVDQNSAEGLMEEYVSVCVSLSIWVFLYSYASVSLFHATRPHQPPLSHSLSSLPPLAL